CALPITGQLFTILFEGISEGKRVITHLHGSRPVAGNIGGQRGPGKNGAKYGSGEENGSRLASHSTGIAASRNRSGRPEPGGLACRGPTLLDAFEDGGAEI